MTLDTLTLRNFRQFKDIHTIEFAYGKKNVTVILGENGRGKTGIFRAIIYACYGNHKLKQDDNVSQEELHLINSVCLKEKENTDDSVEMSVGLKFKHKEATYQIIRKMVGLIRGEKRFEEEAGAILYVTKDSKTETIEDNEKIDEIINSILNEEISEYFLFDGEKIERLTRANYDQRRAIARSIKDLLDIENVKKAMKAVKILKKRLNDELLTKSQGEYGNVLKIKKDLEEQIENEELNKEKYENEYDSAASQKEVIDKRLQEFKKIKEYLIKREEVEKKLEDLDNQKQQYTLEMAQRLGQIPFLFLHELINEIYEKIDQKKSKGEIPSEIRKDLIEKILDEKTCICGEKIEVGTERFKKIMDWKNKTIERVLENSLLNIWQNLGMIKSNNSDLFSNIENTLKNVAKIDHEINEARIILDNIKEKIGNSDNNNALELEKTRNNIENKMIELAAKGYSCDETLMELKDKYQEILQKEEKLLQDEKFKSELSKRTKIAEDTYNPLKEIYEDFTLEVIKALETKANNFFKEFLDDESKKTLSKIVVDDDYSLQILDTWNNSFLANISAGQRQIMSLSFITALAEVASSGKIFEMPLFMDTPFGRLSRKHRENLINKLPEYCKQWILLATDTEVTEAESSLLLKSNKWGKSYLLDSGGAGITNIIEKEIL